MAKQFFRVFHAGAGDDIAAIEMDDSLLDPAAGILHHESMTLRGLKNGGMFTLLPIDDFKVATLKRVRDVYKTVTEKPARHFSTTFTRMDELIEAVGLLFGTVEFYVVDNKDDLQAILNPPKDWEPKKVKYTVLSSLLGEAEAETESTSADDE